MRRFTLGFGVVLLTWLMAASPASAGGWASYVHIEGEHVGVGETRVAHSEAFFTTMQQAQEAKTTRYYAYLVRGHDRSLLRRAVTQPEPPRWWALLPDAELVRVGRVRITNWDANLGEARARIKIPAVTTGRWNLMFCNLGCQQPMGSAVPTVVRVTADAETAQTARRVARLEEQSHAAMSALRTELRTVRQVAAAATADATSTRRQLNDVLGRVHALETAVAQPPSRSWWPWAVAAALAGLLGATVVTTRRRRAATEAEVSQDPVAGDAAWESAKPLVGAGPFVRR